VRASLQYGRRYRATIALEPIFRALVTDAMIAAELERWQLFGQVTETDTGYRIEAKFQGVTGTYDLPEGVRNVEIIE
jgi:hypothetical protein